MKKVLKKNETYIIAFILLLAVIIELRSGSFFQVNNIVDLLNASIVPGLFTISTFMIIVSGGIDVSFPAVAALVSYTVVDVLNNSNYQGSMVLIFLFAAVLGMLCGGLNALFIAYMKQPPLIVTLGTASVFRGLLQGALNAQQINHLPPSMSAFGKSSVYIALDKDTQTTSHLPSSILFLIFFMIIVYFLLNKTMLGRGIYAIGGDVTSAERAGFNVMGIRSFIYVFSGMLAGITGIIRCSLMQMVHPTNLFGMEMTIIAGIILGGASITGGIGSLTGALLGMFLLTLVQNSLLLIGVPVYWQMFFTGAIIIIGISATSIKSIRRKQGRTEALPKEA